MLYKDYDDIGKKALLQKLYVLEKKSFQEIAEQYDTYPNKIRRDAIKFKIKPRDKSDAQKNALTTGKHKHPTKGTKRSEDTKTKIGQKIIEQWENMTNKDKNLRKQKAKEIWDNLTEDEQKQRLISANKAVRNSSKIGSKLEHYILKSLLKDGFKVEFHKEQILSNTKLQLDLFLPTMDIAIEIDGPSHFLPVWGEDSLQRNKKYDDKKSGLILGKGLKLIRIKQTHDFSKTRAFQVYKNLKVILDNTKTTFTNSSIIEIED
jgi:very-short-patch-repair endonuclease